MRGATHFVQAHTVPTSSSVASPVCEKRFANSTDVEAFCFGSVCAKTEVTPPDELAMFKSSHIISLATPWLRWRGEREVRDLHSVRVRRPFESATTDRHPIRFTQVTDPRQSSARASNHICVGRNNVIDECRFLACKVASDEHRSAGRVSKGRFDFE